METLRAPVADGLDDGRLVRRAQDGDRRAFGDLVSRYAAVVHGLCAGVAGPEAARELAHDAFVEAWLKLSTLRDPERFAPWLRTLALNLCRQWLRRRRQARTVTADIELDDLPAKGPTDEDALDSLCVGLARLSRDHRLTLALHYAQGLSYEQIAAFLDVPMGTVMSRLHRAREKLRERMEEMSQGDGASGEAGADGFREAVDAEIEVLLALWEEESPDLRGRFFSTAGKRLSLLVAHSPEAMRHVLATMKDALREHAALLLRRAGGRSIGVAIACAFDEEPALRRTARAVLARVLQRDAGQPLNSGPSGLPLRLTATWVLDAVIRGPQSDADKTALLVELLPGCGDDATLILFAAALRAYGEHAFPLLLARWREAGAEVPAVTVYAAALCPFGNPFFAALAEALTATEVPFLRRALAATERAADLVDTGGLSDVTCPNPALARRVSGRMPPQELDSGVLRDLCGRLRALAAHEDAGVRDRALVVLGLLGGEGDVPLVRTGLRSPHASTRHAAVVGLRALEDRGSVPELLRLACDDEPRVRRVALQTLGHLGAPEARDLLVELIDDEAVRSDAVSALGQIGDDAARAVLRGLMAGPDKKAARLAARALFGGKRTPRPISDLRRQRLAKVRGAEARPWLYVSVVAAIRHLPEARPYREAELTRRIGEVCSDYATTRRELVMGSPGLMLRRDGIYELSDMGLSVWRVERFLKDRDPAQREP